MAILKAGNMTKRFGGLVAVDTLDVEILDNSIHSIIGPNGAGKTTFFNCITGFYRPEGGEIIFNGKPIVGLSPDRIVHRGISRTYQNIRLFPQPDGHGKHSGRNSQSSEIRFFGNCIGLARNRERGENGG